MSHFMESCPSCYMNKGYSIALEKREEGWHCSQCNSNFVLGADGYFKRA